MKEREHVLNRRELARRCKQRNSKYTIQQYMELISILENTVEDILLIENRSVKFGKLLIFKVSEVPERKHWDGVKKKFILLPKRYRITLKPLKRLKGLNRLLLDSKR
ncbi:HU family DNA-binding protein [uncultured Megamonas sp.]|uniref:HU family DNA-binding protein n=1 Tax=uncultured Megamonas sp. TaxID=286140 RepID=UPI00259B8C1C|nr:HU family DNA-binding protein [uncultured Megamonas sp.]